MGINSLETLLQRASNGVKSILQAKSPVLMEVENIAGLKLKPLVSDTVQIAKNKFTKLEQELMDNIKHLKTEDARIIDENGKFVKEFKFIGDETNCKIDPKLSINIDFYIEILPKLKNSTFIHNHPFNTPLSANDVHYMSLNKIKKMMACTFKEGYSYLERMSAISTKQEKNFEKATAKLVKKEMAQIKKLAHTKGITNIERMNRLNDWRYKKIGKVADKFELKFENKIDRLTDLDSIPDNYFSRYILKNNNLH